VIRAKNDALGIRIMCQRVPQCLLLECCLRELALKNPI